MSETAGAVDALEEKLTEALSRVEARLVEETRTAQENTTEIVSHLRAAGGKRMRPLLVLLISQLGNAGGDAPISEDLIAAGVAVELTHLASLYHDDLMDDATVRRGVTAAHVKWNNTLAVMAGDLIFARASLIVSDFGRKLMKHHARTFQRLCLGQMHDILGPGATDDPIEFYLDVLREKTGSLIGTAALYGAALSGCSPEICTAVTAFGEDLGVAFQIADDVLDLRSTAAVSGKTPGADLRDGTKTLPVLLLEKSVAAGGASDADRHLMKMIGDHEALSADAALSEVVDRLAEHRVTRETAALAETWVERALGHLAVLPEGAVKTALTEFSRQQINRLH
ncbi:polyprenyl synthetase family protein [Mobiluncus mulieris]|uniref:polyprenyl synthetase family protein n=1 Tax=Mobiluncus mulieris TaxID=2052 RepID=UPI00242B7C5F|nr:polyprenyl synthetase family protein [Mobiluncus mulieris]